MLTCTDFIHPQCLTLAALAYLISCAGVYHEVFYLVALVIFIYNFNLETVGISRLLAETTSDLEKLPSQGKKVKSMTAGKLCPH